MKVALDHVEREGSDEERRAIRSQIGPDRTPAAGATAATGVTGTVGT